MRDISILLNFSAADSLWWLMLGCLYWSWCHILGWPLTSWGPSRLWSGHWGHWSQHARLRTHRAPGADTDHCYDYEADWAQTLIRGRCQPSTGHSPASRAGRGRARPSLQQPLSSREPTNWEYKCAVQIFIWINYTFQSRMNARSISSVYSLHRNV